MKTKETNKINSQITTQFELMTVEEMEAIIVATDLAQKEGKVKQRRQKLGIINRYVRDILNGDWELNPQPLVITDQGYAIDGMHRMIAAVEAKTDVIFNVTRNWPTIETFKVIDSGTPRTLAQLLSMDGVSYSGKRVAIARGVAIIALKAVKQKHIYNFSVAEVERIMHLVEKSFETIFTRAAEEQAINKYPAELYSSIIYAHTIFPNIATQFADSFFKMEFSSGTGTWALKRWLEKQPSNRGLKPGVLAKITANCIQVWKNKEEITNLRESQEALEWLSDGNKELQNKIKAILGVKG